MNDHKNIEQLFQEKLGSFTAKPKAKNWNVIEEKLQQKKRRVVPIWWYSGGVAALLVFGLFIYPFFLKKDIVPIQIQKDMNPIIITQPKILTPQNELLQKIEPKKEIIIAEKKEQQTAPIIEENLQKKDSISSQKNYKTIQPKKNILANNEIVQKKNQETTNQEKKSIFSELKSNENATRKDSILTQEKLTKKWSVTPVLAFVNSNSFSNTSALDESLKSSASVGNNNVSYGVKVAYQINNKWSVQSGIQVENLSYQNKNLSIVSNILDNSFSNLEYQDSSLDFSVVSSEQAANDLMFNGVSLVTDKATLTQKYSYIEIPVEVKYTFISNSNLKMNFVTGFSSLFLNKNTVSVSSATISQTLGKSKNLNSLNFSSNFGLDFDYSINKNLLLNINPMFKIQLNTFSNNSFGFKPYTLGLYTGFKYQF